jgi:hypothetical protein
MDGSRIVSCGAADRLIAGIVSDGRMSSIETVRLPVPGRVASSDDQRRHGIARMRDAAVDSCATDASRNSEGLTRQRPAALTTVAVF